MKKIAFLFLVLDNPNFPKIWDKYFRGHKDKYEIYFEDDDCEEDYSDIVDDDFYSIVSKYNDDNISNICVCNIEDNDRFHYEIKLRENNSNTFYSNICYFLSYLDFTKQIR